MINGTKLTLPKSSQISLCLSLPIVIFFNLCSVFVLPIGKTKTDQRLKKITIGNDRYNDIWEDLGKVSFVPLITDKD